MPANVASGNAGVHSALPFSKLPSKRHTVSSFMSSLFLHRKRASGSSFGELDGAGSAADEAKSEANIGKESQEAKAGSEDEEKNAAEEASKEIDEEDKADEKTDAEEDEGSEEDTIDVMEEAECRSEPQVPDAGPNPPPWKKMLDDRGPQKHWVDDGDCESVKIPDMETWLHHKKYNVNPKEMFMTKAQKDFAKTFNRCMHETRDDIINERKEEKDITRLEAMKEVFAELLKKDSEAKKKWLEGKTECMKEALNPKKYEFEENADGELEKKEVEEDEKAKEAAKHEIELEKYSEFDEEGLPTKFAPTPDGKEGKKLTEEELAPLKHEQEEARTKWESLTEIQKNHPPDPFTLFTEGKKGELYKAWDERGVPTKTIDGEKISGEESIPLEEEFKKADKLWKKANKDREEDVGDAYLEFKKETCNDLIGKFEGVDPGGKPAYRAAPCRYNQDEDQCEVNDHFHCLLEPCRLTGLSEEGDVDIVEIPGGECGHESGPHDLANPGGRDHVCEAYFEYFDKNHFPDLAIRCETGPNGFCQRSHKVCNPTLMASEDKSSMSDPLPHDGKLVAEEGPGGEAARDQQKQDDQDVGLTQGLEDMAGF